MFLFRAGQNTQTWPRPAIPDCEKESSGGWISDAQVSGWSNKFHMGLSGRARAAQKNSVPEWPDRIWFMNEREVILRTHFFSPDRISISHTHFLSSDFISWSLLSNSLVIALPPPIRSTPATSTCRSYEQALPPPPPTSSVHTRCPHLRPATSTPEARICQRGVLNCFNIRSANIEHSSSSSGFCFWLSGSVVVRDLSSSGFHFCFKIIVDRCLLFVFEISSFSGFEFFFPGSLVIVYASFVSAHPNGRKLAKHNMLRVGSDWTIWTWIWSNPPFVQPYSHSYGTGFWSLPNKYTKYI